MLFNSPQFFIFFIIVYVLYWRLDHTRQNRLLLVASYFFYGYWDWRFLFLMLLSTVIDYVCGLKIHDAPGERTRKSYVTLSIVANLTILGVFKYLDFGINSLAALLELAGLPVPLRALGIILPVGISFYTFQTMSYAIDIYRREIAPTRNFFDFALFVSFFPQLVAGPIERAKNLLPRVLAARRRTEEQSAEGVYLVCLGLFQKVYVADNLAQIVNPVFASAGPYNGIEVWIALYAFAFQIYCDFAGYSNMARGLAKLLGFELMVNFDLPYFSRSPSEFWRRWHISLSTWLKDYLYIPLGGNRRGRAAMVRNLMITMLLGGLWHGASWNFVLWGAYQGLLLVVFRLGQGKDTRSPSRPARQGILGLLQTVLFFHLTCLGWLFFRCHAFPQILQMLHAMFLDLTGDLSVFAAAKQALTAALYILPLLALDLLHAAKKDITFPLRMPASQRALVYFLLLFLITTFGSIEHKEFIYFQF